MRRSPLRASASRAIRKRRTRLSLLYRISGEQGSRSFRTKCSLKRLHPAERTEPRQDAFAQIHHQSSELCRAVWHLFLVGEVPLNHISHVHRVLCVLEPDAASAPLDDDGPVVEQGKTVVYVLEDGTPLGALALADVIRPESNEAIQTLHDLHIDVIMLTGDNERVARWVASELGIDRAIAEVLPDEKSKVIERLKSEGRIVAMTGDGVNDAPALATADVGMAVGAGTDVAAETADIVLVESDPRDAVDVIRLAQATYRKMVQNLWWATGYNVVAIPLAAGAGIGIGVLLSPAAGAVLMSLSTVIVAINARYLQLG